MNNIEEKLNNELAFMYKKYEELCQSYKKLVEKNKQSLDNFNLNEIDNNFYL